MRLSKLQIENFRAFRLDSGTIEFATTPVLVIRNPRKVDSAYGPERFFSRSRGGRVRLGSCG